MQPTYFAILLGTTGSNTFLQAIRIEQVCPDLHIIGCPLQDFGATQPSAKLRSQEVNMIAGYKQLFRRSERHLTLEFRPTHAHC